MDIDCFTNRKWHSLIEG